jgi:chromosome segregation ATPase
MLATTAVMHRRHGRDGGEDDGVGGERGGGGTVSMMRGMPDAMMDAASRRSRRDAEEIAQLRSTLTEMEIESYGLSAELRNEKRAREGLEKELAMKSEEFVRLSEVCESREARYSNLRAQFEILETRVRESESVARRATKEDENRRDKYKIECKTLKRALEEGNREIGRLQVEAERGRMSSEAAERFREELERERKKAHEAMHEVREEAEKERRRVMSLEATCSEVRRVLGDAMEEEFGESVPLGGLARRAADLLCAANSRVKAMKRAQKHGVGATNGNRHDSWIDADLALDAETEAALEEALGTARRWKQATEEERRARASAEEELARTSSELMKCQSELSVLRSAKEESELFETEMEKIVERLSERINQLETAMSVASATAAQGETNI